MHQHTKLTEATKTIGRHRVISIIGICLLSLLGCETKQRSLDFIEDFDSLAMIRLKSPIIDDRLSGRDSCLFSKLLELDLDSLGPSFGNTINVVNSYFIKNYHIEQAQMYFSIVKDPADSFHVYYHTQLRDWAYNKNGDYVVAKIMYPPVGEVSGWRLKDSAKLIRVNTSSIDFIRDDPFFRTQNDSVAAGALKMRDLQSVLKSIWAQFFSQPAGNFEFENFLKDNTNHITSSSLREINILLSNKTGYNDIYKWANYGYLILSVGGNIDNRFEIHFIPFNEVLVTATTDYNYLYDDCDQLPR